MLAIAVGARPCAWCRTASMARAERQPRLSGPASVSASFATRGPPFRGSCEAVEALWPIEQTRLLDVPEPRQSGGIASSKEQLCCRRRSAPLVALACREIRRASGIRHLAGWPWRSPRIRRAPLRCTAEECRSCYQTGARIPGARIYSATTRPRRAECSSGVCAMWSRASGGPVE